MIEMKEFELMGRTDIPYLGSGQHEYLSIYLDYLWLINEVYSYYTDLVHIFDLGIFLVLSYNG